MKWYFAFNERVAGWLGILIKAGVLSARHYTKLSPHCIYDGRDIPLVHWLEERGVKVHRNKVSFRDELSSPVVLKANIGTDYSADAAAGFYLPFAIPDIETEDEFVLFTDADVIFNGPIEVDLVRPATIAAVAEVSKLSDPAPSNYKNNGFNSGVMVINVQEFRAKRLEILAELRRQHFFRFPLGIYDQGVLNVIFRDTWDALPPEYNWRAFWSPNENAKIIHFHGPKPQTISDVLSGGLAPTSEIGRIIEQHKDNLLYSESILNNIMMKDK